MTAVLSPSRSCYDANVPEYYCACYSETPIDDPNSDPMTIAAGKSLIESLNYDLTNVYVPPNAEMADKQRCATLTFDSIESASLIDNSKALMKDIQEVDFMGFKEPSRRAWSHESSKNRQQDYMLIAKAVEKGALFEARITCVDKSQAKFKVVGEVQRVNMYGNQSWCISGSAAAKKFCICESIV